MTKHWGVLVLTKYETAATRHNDEMRYLCRGNAHESSEQPGSRKEKPASR